VTVSTTLDASVLIALMNAGDAHHRDAVTLVRRAAIAGDLIAHPLTIAESAVGAAEHGRLQQVRDAFAGLGLATAPGDPDQPWRLAELRARTRLALPDCCVLDVALESQGALATFDVRLAAAAHEHGVPVAVA
jgi:predicted nucleic acid-binding protein